jgi:adenylate cyclase
MPARPIDEDLYFEILKSEQLRVRTLMVVMAVLFAAALILFALPRESVPIFRLVEGAIPFGEIALFYGAAFLYESIAQAVLGHVIARRRRLPELPRYVNALIETSIPTVMMILVAHGTGPEVALNSPLPLLYIFFICLSTLRLTASLAIFTGCVAGLEYAALGHHYLGTPAGAATYVTSSGPIYAKAVILIGAGVVCGFVAAQIRQRLVASLAALTDRNRVVGMFGQYVSPAVVDELLTRRVEAGGEERNVTMMFLDIRGFTAFAERRTPTEVVDYLNTLFGALIAVVNAHHGIINKFLGDGFMACFGAPLSDGHDVQNAVRAAIEIARTVDRMSTDGTIAPTRVGIGLHAGTAVTGSVGSEERREYTIIGDTVNVASRVEQLTKHYGVVVLVTEAVWRLVKDEYEAQPLEAVVVRGREEPVAVYALR